MFTLFSKYLLIGLSAIVLAAAGQQGLFNKQVSVTQAAACDPNGNVDPNTWSLIEEWECEPGNPGVKAHKWACFGDDGTPQAIKYTDGASDTDKCPLPSQSASAAPVCERKDEIGRVEDCVGDQVCTFNIWQGPKEDGSCQTGRGGAYNCRRVIGQCGAQQPARGGEQQVQQVQQQQQEATAPAPSQPASSQQPAPVPSGTGPAPVPVRDIVTVNPVITNNPTITNTFNPVNTNTSTNTSTNTVTINNPAQPTPQVVLAAATPIPAARGGNVGVGTTVYATQLPKTGLPALAWSALAFIPAGLGLRKFRKLQRALENHPSFIWEDRQFKS